MGPGVARTDVLERHNQGKYVYPCGRPLMILGINFGLPLLVISERIQYLHLLGREGRI